MKKILITGITGFAGSHLAQYLLDNSYISGTYLSESSLKNVESIKNKLNLIKVDLTDYLKVFEVLKSLKPDTIYHLAALPSPAASFKNPAAYLTNNILAELNVLESIKNNHLSDCRILVVTSAEVYGIVAPEDLPIEETTSFKPVSPYAVSKIAQDYLGLQYFLAYKLRIIRVRPFAHIGPRLSQDFVVSAFCKKIAEIEKGKREPILTVGNLESKRDFTDVKDIVRAYTLLIEKGQAGEVYNVGSGISYKIKEILEMLLSFSKVKVEIKVDESLLRPNDIPELRCDNSKVKELTGWEPTVKIEESLKETLEYWRNAI